MKLDGRLMALAVALLIGGVAAPAHADGAATSFCALLSTESAATCVPATDGPQAAWDAQAAKWRPRSDGVASQPLVALWASPGVGLDELARNKDGVLVAFTHDVDAAMAFAAGKNAPSSLASMKAQKDVLDKIRARQDELHKAR